MIGRRVSSIAEVKEPGDYCGPITGYTAVNPGCFFLLPIARDKDVESLARSIHHVEFPPHTFRECDDGSLEIRESIGALGQGGKMIWHGFLDEGHVWREV